jgi:hypothetical protein
MICHKNSLSFLQFSSFLFIGRMKRDDVGRSIVLSFHYLQATT